MDRRSFVATLVGGLALAGSGAAYARATPKTAEPQAEPVALDSDALDATDAEFTQMSPGERRAARRARRRGRQRQRVRRRMRRRMRRRWRNNRWYYY